MAGPGDTELDGAWLPLSHAGESPKVSPLGALGRPGCRAGRDLTASRGGELGIDEVNVLVPDRDDMTAAARAS